MGRSLENLILCGTILWDKCASSWSSSVVAIALLCSCNCHPFSQVSLRVITFIHKPFFLLMEEWKSSQQFWLSGMSYTLKLSWGLQTCHCLCHCLCEIITCVSYLTMEKILYAWCLLFCLVFVPPQAVPLDVGLHAVSSIKPDKMSPLCQRGGKSINVGFLCSHLNYRVTLFWTSIFYKECLDNK